MDIFANSWQRERKQTVYIHSDMVAGIIIMFRDLQAFFGSYQHDNFEVQKLGHYLFGCFLSV